MKRKSRMIAYPSRIEKSLIDEANKHRRRSGLSWPQVTRLLLGRYIKTKQRERDKQCATKY